MDSLCLELILNDDNRVRVSFPNSRTRDKAMSYTKQFSGAQTSYQFYARSYQDFRKVFAYWGKILEEGQ